MEPAGWVTLALVGVAAVLLVTERLRPDLTALLILIVLSLTGIVRPDQAFAGFSQSAVITIMAIFILTFALEQTGVTHWVGMRLLRGLGASESRLATALMLTAAALSLVMNSIAAAAVLLPSAVAIARHTNRQPSRLLMPLSFGALIGGTATLLTTANILVSTTLTRASLTPFGLFDFLPTGLLIIAGGALVTALLGPRLLPSRDMAGEVARMRRLQTELAQVYHLGEGLTALTVLAGSPLAGQTLRDGAWGQRLGLTVLGIAHQGHVALAPNGDTEIREGDIVLVEGTPTAGMLSDFGLHPSPVAEGLQPTSEDVRLVEVILAPRSDFDGRTLKNLHFREKFGMQVLALWRQGQVVQPTVADIPLRFGDAMLMQGSREKVEVLRSDPNLIILEEEGSRRVGRKGYLAAAILALSLGLAASGVLPIALATLTGAALVILTGCIRMDEAYRAIEWRTVFLIACMIPLGVAMLDTGAASFLATTVQSLTGGLGALATAAVLLLLTITLSLFLGGQTTAVVVAPVAIEAAALVHADPRGMAMAVAIGCSLVFLSPLGHPANLLVMAPGGYRPRDYFRLGLPVTVVTFVLALVGLHWVWGL
ncbi:MAG TPA: SLC13 family permease [Anaerolineales bacterium]|nr:SLC13 family permease [Anaerolineales bacterium]